MNIEQKLIYQNKEFTIISSEQEFIVHPAAFTRYAPNAASMQCSFCSNFEVKEYKLYLNKIIVGNYDAIISAEVEADRYTQLHEYDALPVSYNGAVLIGFNPMNEYFIKGGRQPACFSYQKVYELIFEKGILITSVDQSRAMQRIRKNLERGQRCLNRSRDLRCILRFMNSSFIGDYKPFRFNFRRIGYIKEMKKDYQTLELINR